LALIFYPFCAVSGFFAEFAVAFRRGKGVERYGLQDFNQ
jgi:hypothetical protein